MLDVVTSGGVHQAFGTRIDGVTLRATDLPWQFGDGPSVSATADDLILALAGRAVDPSRIDGTLP